MVQNLLVAHRQKPSVFHAGPWPVWNTCLRSLAIVDPTFEAEAEPKDQVYSGQQAYQFLLELICGLHSPVVGETEVFGQFKTFATEWVARQPQKASLVQRLLGDAKAIRTQYLNQIGIQSYGSWVRKQLRASEVHIIGGGQLAKEVLPYVQKQASSVALHVRTPSKVDFFNGAIHQFKANGFTAGAVIIAAPVSAAEVSAWLGGHQPSELFDLRETSLLDSVPVSSGTTVYHLSDIFLQIEKTKQRLLPVIEQIKIDISNRAEKLAHQGLLRPQGWDDLSA